MEKCFKGAGAVSWTTRKQHLRNLLTLYCIAWDGGPENAGMTPRIVAGLRNCIQVMVSVIFCFMHRMHLGFIAVLDAVAEFAFDGEDISVGLLSGLKTVANVWRSTGMHTKLNETAASLYGEPVAAEHFEFHDLRSRLSSTRLSSRREFDAANAILRAAEHFDNF